MKDSTSKKLSIVGFLFIPMLLVIIFYIYPILRSIFVSFHSWDGISPNMTFVGLENYRNLIASPRFREALSNNLRWLVFYLLFPTTLGLGLAILTNLKAKGENFFKTIFFLPFTLTPVAVAAIWRWLYDPYQGLFQRILGNFGIGNPSTATFALMLACLWWTTGLAFLLYLSGLKNIPPELMEAAKIDGASPFKLFIHIMFPMLLPYTIVIVAISGIEAMRLFDLVYVLTGGGPGYSTEVLATQMYDVSFSRFQMGMGTTISVILFLITVLIILPYILYSNRKMEGIR